MALFATYPADPAVLSWASTNGVDPDAVFAFAATHSRLPQSLIELNAWVMQAEASGNWPVGTPTADEYAYIEEHLTLPHNINDVRTWLETEGYFDSSGNPTGQTPRSGQYYDQATGQTSVPTPSGTSTPTPTGFSLDSAVTFAKEHPIIVVGVAGGLVLAYIALRRI